MTQKPVSFDKEALRTLAEKYLASSVLKEDILNFSKTQIPKNSSFDKGNIAQLLSERVGKSRNSIYRNQNEFTNYSAVSLLRYWQAMYSLCIENNVSPDDMPSLDNLLTKYEDVLEFINQIAIEDDLTILIEHHLDTFIKLYDVFELYLNNNKKRTINPNEKSILNKIAQQPVIQNELNAKKSEQLERMKKK